jgi:GTP-binding nuclear protein Ran
MEQKKLILVGDGGSGKTCFTKRLLNDVFEKSYIPTLGYEVYPYTDLVNNIQYNIWDTAGQEKFGGLSDGYYLMANLAVIMCDDRKLSQKSIIGWKKDIERMCPGIPIYIVYNKSDIKIWPDVINISVKNNTGITDLFDLLSKETV